MPKFTVREKKKILGKLRTEGEKLFNKTDLRKVTIDDLSSAAGISHSAFYAFYESKEQLFMEINGRKQRGIYDRLEHIVEANQLLPSKDLARLYVTCLEKEFFADPVISTVKGDLLEYIARKVPPQTLEHNDLIDERAVCELSEAGVRFKYPEEYTVKAIQAVFIGLSGFETDDDREKLAETLIDALIDKLVE